MFHIVIIEVEHSIWVGTMGEHESGVNIVVTNGALPHGLTQGIAFRIGPDDALIVIQAFVHHIPCLQLALEVLHDVGDMILHKFEGLLPCPILVVLLAIAAQP